MSRSAPADVDVRTEGLVALLAGGLAFDTPAFAPPGEPAAANTVFTLYGDRATAMKQPESGREALCALLSTSRCGGCRWARR